MLLLVTQSLTKNHVSKYSWWRVRFSLTNTAQIWVNGAFLSFCFIFVWTNHMVYFLPAQWLLCLPNKTLP